MLCSKCGAENPAEARFCGKCGAAVTSRPPVTPAVENPVVRTEPKSKSRLSPPLILAGAAVVVFGIIGIVVVAHFASSSRQTVSEPYDSSFATTTMPPAGVPPSPSKLDDYNNAPSAAANAGRPGTFAESSDAAYARKIIGTWRVRKFIQGAFVDVKCMYMPGGRASWSGTLTYMGRQTFLLYSGSWEVENGFLHTRIESSNVPQLVPVGMTGGSRFVSVTDYEWTFVDLSDGQTGSAVRMAGN